MGLKSFDFVVKGAVQGVNFRYWKGVSANCTSAILTSEPAIDRGLSGKQVKWTGHVSGVAEGDSDALDKFAQLLRKGPSAAEVADVIIDKHEDISAKKYSSFDVEH